MPNFSFFARTVDSSSYNNIKVYPAIATNLTIECNIEHVLDFFNICS